MLKYIYKKNATKFKVKNMKILKNNMKTNRGSWMWNRLFNYCTNNWITKAQSEKEQKDKRVYQIKKLMICGDNTRSRGQGTDREKTLAKHKTDKG